MPKITIPHGTQEFLAHLALPEGTPKGGVILIHEVWGVNPNIRSLADRLAMEGYVVIAPDLITHTGINQQIDQSILAEIMNPETRDEAQKKLRAAMAPIMVPEFANETIDKLKTCFDYLQNEQNQTKIASVGFCFGGTYSYSLAVHEPRLACAVPFYGHAPQTEAELSRISCQILAFYGEEDAGLMEGLPILVAEMKKLGKDFTYKVYQDAGHAFMNDTNPTTYRPEAAKDAWERMIVFLSEKMA